MSVEINDVSIRCMGCSQQSNLDDALRNTWKMCNHCSFYICPLCIEHLGDLRRCLSFVCSQKNREIDAIGLPVEKILIFAREYDRRISHQGLLYKLFYEEGERVHSLPFFATVEKQEKSGDEPPTQIQEEIWKNFQLVITKRRGGKFITWERVL